MLARGWAGPGLADGHRRRAGDARGRRAQLRCATAATAGGCASSPTPAASRSSTSSRSRATCCGVVASEMPSTWKPEALRGAGDRRAHLRGGDAQARDELLRPLPGRAQPGLPRARGREADGVGRRRRDRRAGRALPGPADRDVLLLVLRAVAPRPPRRSSRAPSPVPYLVVGRRPLRHDLAVPRLDALADRSRALAEGDLPGPRHGRPGGRLSAPAACARSR